MRYVVSKKVPPFRRVLLIESGRRQLLEDLLNGLYQVHPDMRADLITCYGGAPQHFDPGRGFIYRVTDYPSPAARKQLYSELAANAYTVVGILCSAEPIMTKWKWMLAARLPAKVFILNENGDYFWLDRGHWSTIRHFVLVPGGPVGRRRGPHHVAPAAVPVRSALPDPIRSHRSSPEKITNAMKAVFVETPGGPENLKYADLPKPKPGPGQALVKIAAAGVNFIDIYFRTGLYKADPPVVLGNEGAGTVEAVGSDVTDVEAGRSRRLRDGARILCRVRRGARLATGQTARSRRFSRPRRRPCCRA